MNEQAHGDERCPPQQQATYQSLRSWRLCASFCGLSVGSLWIRWTLWALYQHLVMPVVSYVNHNGMYEACMNPDRDGSAAFQCQCQRPRPDIGSPLHNITLGIRMDTTNVCHGAHITCL